MKVGLLVGRENTFPQPFIDRVNQKGGGDVTADFVRIGPVPHTLESEYRVIVDRISHEVPFYREYLKVAMFRGTIVINDPFWWTADDKFFNCALAEELGVAVPKTVALPHKSYIPGITSESLRNLMHPIDWNAILEYTGTPAFMKPAVGGGWKNVYKVNSVQELVSAFDETGELPMIVQEGIEFDDYARCICLGRKHIQVIRYNPNAPFHERYVVHDSNFGAKMHDRIAHDALLLCEGLGYDMNTVEFAIRGGVPYAIDFLNPAPDFDSFSIKEYHFEWVLETLSDLVIELATSHETRGEGYRWFPMTPNARTHFFGGKGSGGR